MRNRFFKNIILFIQLLLLSGSITGQSALPKKLNDSLWSLWNNTKLTDTVRLKAMDKISWEGYLFTLPDSAFYYAQLQFDFAEKKGHKKYMSTALSTQGVSHAIRGNYPLAIECFSKSLKIAQDNGDKKGMAVALNNIGNIYRNQGDYAKALESFEKSKKIDDEIGNISGGAAALNNIGSIYYDQGNFALAIDYLTRSLKIKEKIGNKQGVATSLANIGNIYKDQGDFDQALTYYTKSLKIHEEISDKNGVAATLSSIGTIYKEQKKLEDALTYFNKSLKLQEETEDLPGIATSYSNIGSIYNDLENWDQSLLFYNKGLIIDEKLGNKQGVAIALNDIGNIYFKKKDLAKALKNSKKAMILATELGSANITKNAALSLGEIYKKTGDFKESLKMFELFVSSRDSLLSEQSQREVLRQGFKYDYEKKATADSVKAAEEKKIKDAQIAKQNAEIKVKKNQQFMLFGGLILVLIFAVFMYNRFTVTKKQKQVIEVQKLEVEKQRDIINEKNELITESIEYAKTIQEAIVTSDDYLKSLFKDFFVLYKPKDIVSGDFYWAYKSKSNKVFWAAADCTGHGVPGAFMTMIGSSLLNEIIVEKEIEETNLILDQLRDQVIKTLNKNIDIDSDEKMRNGMDIALCCLELNNNILSFSGANNPLIVIREGEILEFKADKQPIGIHKKMNPFTIQNIEIKKGDRIYTFSDGYADQMNDEGKRYKIANLRKTIIDAYNISMSDQKEYFNNKYEIWRGSYEQIDDVVMIGVEI